MSLLLWSLTSQHGTGEARMNTKIKQMLTKYEAWWLLIWASTKNMWVSVTPSMMIAPLALVIQLSLTYPHVPDETKMNNHQASYLVSICLISVFAQIKRKCKRDIFWEVKQVLDRLNQNFPRSWILARTFPWGLTILKCFILRS